MTAAEQKPQHKNLSDEASFHYERNHPRLALAAYQPEHQTLDVAQTDYFVRSALATTGRGERSMVSTLSAAAVQKVRPVMQ